MDIVQLKAFYQSLSPNECIPLVNIEGLRQIVLIRHAKPTAVPKRLVNYADAQNYLQDYREASIVPFGNSPICQAHVPVQYIYHSALKRARDTAHAIFYHGNFEFIEDERYNEFDRNNIRLPFKIPHSLHTQLSRLAWLFGKADGIENIQHALLRVKTNAHHLSMLAYQHQMVILVAHGFHNYFVARNLRRKGWKWVLKGGNDHLAVNILSTEVAN